MPLTCVSLFLAASDRAPQRVALIEGDRAVTYGALRAIANERASRLAAAGIRAGDRVVVLIPMSVELYAWLIGLLLVDATVMFVEPWMPLELIAECCAKAQPAAILASPMGALLAQRAPAFRSIPRRLLTRGAFPFAWMGWDTPPDAAHAVPKPDAGADDMAVLTFTTGSSGAPKGVVRTHGLLEAQHRVLTKALQLSASDVCLHAFANFILNNLALGASSVIPRIRPSAPTKFSPASLAEQIARAQVTSLICPPASLDRLVTWAEASRRAFSTVRNLGTGGGPVPLKLLERAAAVFPAADPEVLYGSSEVEPVSHARWSEVKALSGEGACVGHPVPEVQVRLLDHGELAVSGPHVSPRYFEDPAAMAKAKVIDPDGTVWHRMGDTVARDAEGRLWLTGRVHNLVATTGGTVATMPLERRAEQLEFVAGAAAVGVGPPGQATVVLAVEPRRWEPSSFDPWRKSVAQRVPEAGRVLFVRRIPRDRRHQSKVDYARVAQLVERGGRAS